MVPLIVLGVPASSSAAVPAFVVFSSDRDGDGRSIYRMNLDGSGLTRLTPKDRFDTVPAISPDGTKIAYASDAALRVMNADGSNARTVATAYNWITSTDWSPDGSKLVYTVSGGGASNNSPVRIVNADGTGEKTLSGGQVTQMAEFTPDGNILYLDRTNAGIVSSPQLWLITPDGSYKRKLREKGFSDFTVPKDGKGIILTSSVYFDGKYRGAMVYYDDIDNIADLNNEPTSVIWQGDGTVSSPVVGADGRIIHSHDPEFWLFETTDNDITVINRDGAGRKKLTGGGSNDTAPDWYTGTPAPPPAPQVMITSAPSGTIIETRPSFTFRASDSGTFECRLQNRTTSTDTGFERCSDVWQMVGSFTPSAALTHGAHTFSVRTVGISGQRSQVATRDFTVQTSAGPKLTSVASVDFGETPHLTERLRTFQVTNTGQQAYEAALSLDGPARFDYRLSGATCGTATRITIAGGASCWVNVTYKPRYTGVHQAALAFEAILPGHPAHRVELTGVGTSEAPSAPNIVDAPDYTNSRRPSFEYEATDTVGDEFECRLYPVGQTPPEFDWCNPAQGTVHTAATDLADGEYTFEVRAFQQGNPTPYSDPAAADFVVDTVAPTISIDDAPTVTDDVKPAFTFSSNEPGIFWCRFDPDDGGTFERCSESGATSGATHRPADALTNGEHVFQVRSYDRAGNVSELASATFTVSSEAPSAPRDLIGSAITKTSAQVRFTAPEDPSNQITAYDVTCQSDDGGNTVTGQGSRSPVTLEGLTPGSHYTCTATATSAVGTSAASEASPRFLQAIAPDAPSEVTASLAGQDSVQVSFLPGDDGGSPASRFDVQCSPEDGTTTRSGQGTGSPVTVVGLAPGGSYTCVARATNAVGDGEWSQPSPSIKVPGDPDPVALITGPDKADEGDTVSLSAATSTGVGPLTFAWDTDGDGDYDDGTGPSISVDARKHGALMIGLSVTDANDEKVTTDHTVTVANVAPQVAPLADQQVAEGEALSVAGSFADPGDNTWTATVDFGDGPQPLTLVGRTFTVSHAAPIDGTVTVRVCDDANACDQQRFAVEVTHAPAPPVAVINGADRTDEGTTVTFSGSASTGVGPLTFAWDSDGDGDYDDGTGPSISVNARKHGTLTVRLRVTDADDERATTSHALTVDNVEPVVDPMADQMLAHDDELSVAGSFADPGDNNWAATVDFGDGPQPLKLTGRTFTVAWADAVSTTVKVRVCDDAGACDETSFDVEVMAPPGPVVVLDGPSEVVEGSKATFTAEDSTGVGALTYAWDTDDDGDHDDGTQASVEVDFPAAGTRTLGLRVTDQDGATTVLHTVRVTAVSPTIAPIEDRSVDDGEKFTVEGSFTDPGDNTWTASVDFGDGPQSLDLDGTSFTIAHAYAKAGSHRVVVQVCDDHQACDNTAFTVTVGQGAGDGDRDGSGPVPRVPGLSRLPGVGAVARLDVLGVALLALVSGLLLVRTHRRRGSITPGE